MPAPSGGVAFEQLPAATLVLDATYVGGEAGTVADDPIAKLLPVGNQGGFRAKKASGVARLVALYTTGSEADWPDRLDAELGELVYYGDNRRPGHELHKTPRGGNRLLLDHFGWAAGTGAERAKVPPYFLFEKAGVGRAVRFRGLLVPGSERQQPAEWLVAVWKRIGDQRFQNYRATFSVLAAPKIERAWIDEVLAGNSLGTHCPAPWRAWVETSKRAVLRAEPSRSVRSPAEQAADPAGEALLDQIRAYFHDYPQGFEACAVEIWRMLAPATGLVDVTRPWRDGGRDAVGAYLLGPIADRVAVEFALEAKLYAAGHSVGVREMSRLIARLRYRQFGVFVTTSHFAQQAYEEVRADGHPIVLIAARDIVQVLQEAQLGDPSVLAAWLAEKFDAAPPGAFGAS